MTRRRLLIVAAAVAAVLSGASLPAWAYFTASATAPVTASATSLVAASGLSAGTVSSSQATVSWADNNPPGTIYTGTATMVQAPNTVFSCAVTGLSCTASGLAANTEYTFSVTPALGNWTGPAATKNLTTQPAAAFRLTGVSFGGAVNGRPEAGDTMTLTFNANVKVTTVPTAPTVTFSRASNSVDTFVTITGVLASPVDTGGQGYLSQAGSRSASFTSTVTVSGATIVIKLGTQSGDTVGAGSSATNTVSIPPATGITDTSGNGASGSFTTGTDFAFF